MVRSKSQQLDGEERFTCVPRMEERSEANPAGRWRAMVYLGSLERGDVRSKGQLVDGDWRAMVYLGFLERGEVRSKGQLIDGDWRAMVSLGFLERGDVRSKGQLIDGEQWFTLAL